MLIQKAILGSTGSPSPMTLHHGLGRRGKMWTVWVAMARKCVWVRIHLVWSTKYREPLIADHWQEQLYAYIAGIIRNKAGKLICIGGTADHIHIYLSLPSRISLSVMVNAIKTHSSSWVRANHRADFRWQRGYGAFSMNLKNERSLKRYIANQRRIHGERDSGREYLWYARAHGIRLSPDLMD